MALRADCHFSPGYWEALMEAKGSIAQVVLIGGAAKMRIQGARAQGCVPGSEMLILSGADLCVEAVISKLLALAWYGCPGEVIFMADTLLHHRLLEEYYEPFDNKEAWENLDEFVKRIRYIDIAVCNCKLRWCFTWDADFVILIADAAAGE